MKVDIDEFREIYLSALQRKLQPNEVEIAKGTLDAVISEFAQGKKAIIEELADTTKYSHGVFGCFKRGGHYLQEAVGPNPSIKSYADGESEYAELFNGETSGPEFIARISGKRVEDGFTLRLVFNDRQGDHRGNSHTDYTLFVPESEVDRIVPLVKDEPITLSEVFQRVFPDYDRSNDTLAIDTNKIGKIDYPS